MRHVLLALAVSLFCSRAIADGDGVGVIPFSSAGDYVTGTIEVHDDGTIVVRGEAGSVPFLGVGTGHIGDDGQLYLDCDLYTRTDGQRPEGGTHALKAHLRVNLEDGADGNPTDDAIGGIDIERLGAGRGTIDVTA
jgi:hypothetical protein